MSIAPAIIPGNEVTAMCKCQSGQVLSALIGVLLRQEARGLEESLRYQKVVSMYPASLQRRAEADLCTKLLGFIERVNKRNAS
jgi:hypothetical protein